MTSPSQVLLIHAAELYGGEVRQWVDAPGEGIQWELYTDVDTLDVLIPPGSLSQSWEMWSGGGCLRRCSGATTEDGEVCKCPADLAERSALAGRGKACKAMTRLSVVLPRLPDVGVWRVTTSSLHAGIEMPGTVDLLEGALENLRLIPASLIIEQRTDIDQGQTRHFGVPVLALHSVTTESIMAGTAGIAIGQGAAPSALGAPAPVPALGTGEPHDPEPSDDEPSRTEPPPDLGALMERINALRPSSRVADCMRAFRAKFGAPTNLTADRFDEAVTFVAGWEPVDAIATPQPPSAPSPTTTAPEPPQTPQQAAQTPIPAPADMDRADLVTAIVDLDPKGRVSKDESDGDLRLRLEKLRAKVATEALALNLGAAS
jgi:hypothetical protein